MHEHIVHTLHDAVPFHPKVVAIGVGPVPVDPDPLGTADNRLLHHDGPWRRWRCLRSRGGFRLLNDDDRLAIDLLGGAGLGFDDHVGRGPSGLALLPVSHVAIV
jgi:hypothetical protein